jgi:MYXO-CTERM domain-containing protein
VKLPPHMRRNLATALRGLTGGRPVLSACVVSTAVATAALQSSGVEVWWVLPLLVLVALTGRLRRRSR